MCAVSNTERQTTRAVAPEEVPQTSFVTSPASFSETLSFLLRDLRFDYSIKMPQAKNASKRTTAASRKRAAATSPVVSAEKDASPVQRPELILDRILRATSKWSSGKGAVTDLQARLDEIVDLPTALIGEMRRCIEEKDGRYVDLPRLVCMAFIDAGYVHKTDATAAAWVAPAEIKDWVPIVIVLTQLVSDFEALVEATLPRSARPEPKRPATTVDDEPSFDEVGPRGKADGSVPVTPGLKTPDALRGDPALADRVDSVLRGGSGEPDGPGLVVPGNEPLRTQLLSDLLTIPTGLASDFDSSKAIEVGSNGVVSVATQKFPDMDRWHEYRTHQLLSLPVASAEEKLFRDEFCTLINLIVGFSVTYKWDACCRFEKEVLSKLKSGELRRLDEAKLFMLFQRKFGTELKRAGNAGHASGPRVKEPKGARQPRQDGVCKFFKMPRGCKKGDNCNFKHEN